MAKNEAKIRFTAETGGFNSEIKKSNEEMSRLRAELNLNEAQMKTTGASVETLENKHQILSAQLAASESKTEALSQKVNKAAEIFGENSTEVNKLRTQLLNAQTAETKIRQAISACNDELEAQRSAANKTETASEQLTNTIKDQQRQLDKLKGEYVDAVLQYGETSDEAKTLERSINDLSGELKQSKKTLSDAAGKANDLDKSLEKVDDSADAAGDGFTVLKGTVADLASNAIQGAIGKIGEFMDYLADLPSATMDLRQSMSTMTTSFDHANFSTTQAKDTWKELYAVFGDDQTAVEAANHISRMSDNQKDLNDWVTISTGLYASYQDAINPAGIAEAAKETAACGKVTGQFADALNWSSEAATMFAGYMSEDVTTAEDAFNVALSECTSEQERQQLITDTLTALYGDAANTYRDTASAQMEAKEAAAEQMLAENNLATAIEPVTTEFAKLKAQLLEGLKPAVEAVSNAMTSALQWAQEHPVAMKVLAAVIGVVTAAITALIAVVIAWTAAQWALNSAILANPITWIIVGIVAAIAAVVAIIVIVIEYWDQIVAAVEKACSAVVSALSKAWEWIKGVFTGIGNWVNTNVIQPVVNFFVGLWTKLKEIWNTICNVIQVAFMFIGSIISAAFDIITLPFRFIWENCKEYVFAAWEWIKNAVSTAINAVKNVITTVMNAIKNVFTTAWNGIKSVFTTVWNAIANFLTPIINKIKSVITTVFGAIKNTASNIWNGIKNAISNTVNSIKNTISNVFNNVKSKVSSVFNGIKSTATTVWNGIKNAITKPIEAARDKIKGIIDKIKGFFSNLKLKFPNIKMPHFKITGSFSLNPPSVPKLSIEWYKDGGIMMKPTIFGMNGNKLMAGGEAGPEAILPIDRLEDYISGAIEKAQNVVNLQSLADAIADLANRPIQMNINGRQFAMATANDSDGVNGLRTTFKNRGLTLG